MRSTVSGSLLCLSSALVLLHVVAQAQDVGSQPNPKSRSGAEAAAGAEAGTGTGAGTGAAAAALGLEVFSADTAMNPLGHAPVYSRHGSKPAVQQNIQSDSDGNNNDIIDSIINSNSNEINSSERQLQPHGANINAQGGTIVDDHIAKMQKWLNSPTPPRKLTRGGSSAPRHDVNQDPCARIGSGSGGGPISYDMIKACLDTDFGFPVDVRQDTIDTVKSLISNFYVFEDLAAHPPRDGSTLHLSFQPVELIKEIDAWFEQSKSPATATDDQGAAGDGVASVREAEKKQLGEEEKEDLAEDDGDDAKILEAQRAWGGVRTKMTDREFHDGISRILLRARDGHLSYDADCFRAFRFQHGFFMSHVVRDGKTVIKVHSVAPYFPYQNGVTEDILNCDVLTIEGRNAVDYIQDWADRYISMSKDENVRYDSLFMFFFFCL